VKEPTAAHARLDHTQRSSPDPPSPTRGLISARLLGGGSEPDPRFSLANERTFLAWIRTSLAFIAGGIAIEVFADTRLTAELRQGLASVLLGLGMIISAGAAIRWLRVERAMRHAAPLPLAILIPVLSAFGVGAAIILVIVTLWG
jgi:putative membrane protein